MEPGCKTGGGGRKFGEIDQVSGPVSSTWIDSPYITTDCLTNEGKVNYMPSKRLFS